MEKRRSTQLYSQIESLASQVQDESDIGLLVGYSIAKSLMEFSPLQYGREPRAFKEVWAVYDGLSKAAVFLKSHEARELVSTLKKEVNSYLGDVITNPDHDLNKESDLLKQLVDSAKVKHLPLEQFLKEIGSKVSKGTLEHGLSQDAINRIFTEDYKLLERSFSK